MSISFLELYDSYSPEDKDKLMEMLLKNLQGIPTRPITIRKTFKVSSLGTKEEIRQRIADNYNTSIGVIPEIDTDAELTRLNKNWLALNQLISPYKLMLESNKNTSPDKYEELMDLGRLILSMPENLQIVVTEAPLKYPDFIVKNNGINIGIEHTRLINPELKAMFNCATKYIQNAHTILDKKNKSLTGTVNVFINYSNEVIGEHDFINRKFTVAEKKKIPNIIADYIESELTGGVLEKPNFIDRLGISANPEPRLDIIHAEHYIAKEGFLKLIHERIAAKEKKISNYIQEAEVKTCWLLIVIDGVSSFSGFDLRSEPLPNITGSSFEKIILLESLSGTYIIAFDKEKGQL